MLKAISPHNNDRCAVIECGMSRVYSEGCWRDELLNSVTMTIRQADISIWVHQDLLKSNLSLHQEAS